MKKAILKGAAAVAILAAWFVLPNIGAHAEPNPVLLCSDLGELAGNVAAGRDKGTPAVVFHNAVEARALPELRGMMHDTIDNVYSAPGLDPLKVSRLTSAACVAGLMESQPEQKERTMPASRATHAKKGAV